MITLNKVLRFSGVYCFLILSNTFASGAIPAQQSIQIEMPKMQSMLTDKIPTVIKKQQPKTTQDLTNVFASTFSHEDLTGMIFFLQQALLQQEIQTIDNSVRLITKLRSIITSKSITEQMLRDLASKHFPRNPSYGINVVIDELTRLAYNDYVDGKGKPNDELLKLAHELESGEK